MPHETNVLWRETKDTEKKKQEIMPLSPTDNEAANPVSLQLRKLLESVEPEDHVMSDLEKVLDELLKDESITPQDALKATTNDGKTLLDMAMSAMDLFQPDGCGYTKYCLESFVKIIKTLIENEEPEVQSKVAGTALFKILGRDYTDNGTELEDYMDPLVGYNPDLTYTDEQGNTCLFVFMENEEPIEPMHEQDTEQDDGESLLFGTFWRHFQRLVELGADPKAKRKDGRTLWHVAAGKGYFSLIDRLATLDGMIAVLHQVSGLVKNQGDHDGMTAAPKGAEEEEEEVSATPLHFAAVGVDTENSYNSPSDDWIDYTETIDRLLAHLEGHDPKSILSTFGAHGETPLHWACRGFANRKFEITMSSLEETEKAEGNCQREQQETIRIVRHLLALPNGIDALSMCGLTNGQSPLHVACMYGRNETVTTLLSVPSAGSMIDTIDSFGLSPVMWASFRCNVENIFQLVRQSAFFLSKKFSKHTMGDVVLVEGPAKKQRKE